jgi:16S rRNA (cytosine967-C5)-methyltransferase
MLVFNQSLLLKDLGYNLTTFAYNQSLNMKLHPSLIIGVETCLERTFLDNRKVDKVLAELFKQNSKWGARDRGFIAENAYDIVRWWRKIKYSLGIDGIDVDKNKIKQITQIWLAINNKTPKTEESSHKAVSVFKSEALPEAIKYSLPQWLYDLGLKQMGNHEWSQVLEVINDPAPVFLRANTEKNNRTDLKTELQSNGVETKEVEGSTVALQLEKRQNVFTTQAFKDGLFEVQDPGSQKIVDYLEVGPGMRVIDACAGAGGKSLYISNLMQNKGHIIALDVEQWKLDELKRRARRNSAHNIETKLIVAKTIKRLRNTADRVLLDVPCSGLGTIRRNPDAKWKLSEKFINEVARLQSSILRDYAKMVKVGGIVVYATCSILPMENEEQVEQFLKENPNFSLSKQDKTNTAFTGFDGFYMAQLVRNS